MHSNSSPSPSPPAPFLSHKGRGRGSVRYDAEQTQVRTELPLPQGARKGEREMRRREDLGPHRASASLRRAAGGARDAGSRKGCGINIEKNDELQNTYSTYLRVKRHFSPLAPRVSTKIMNYQSTIASLYTTIVSFFVVCLKTLHIHKCMSTIWFRGILDTWFDDKGYGFITPDTGGRKRGYSSTLPLLVK